MYKTLCISLANSLAFGIEKTWKNKISYTMWAKSVEQTHKRTRTTFVKVILTHLTVPQYTFQLFYSWSTGI